MTTWKQTAGRKARMPGRPSTSTAPSVSRRIDWPTFRRLMAEREAELAALAEGRRMPPDTTPPVRTVEPIIVRTPPQAANDNKPRGVVVPLPDHREERREAPSESTPDRIRRALYKSAPNAYRALCRIDELLRPAETSVPETPVADNDNNEWWGVGIDFRHDVDPGDAADLIDAMGDGMRPRVRLHRNGKVERFAGGMRFVCDEKGNNEFVEIGGHSSTGRFYGLQWYRGSIIAYGKNGRKVAPAFEQSDPRGPDTADSPVVHDIPYDPLAEMARADAGEEFVAGLQADAVRRLRLILEADSFAEVGRAEGYAESGAHKHGRRITIATLETISEKIAA